MCIAPGFEPARKQFEPPQKGERQCAGLRQQILPGGAAILLGVPENQNHRMVVFIFKRARFYEIVPGVGNDIF